MSSARFELNHGYGIAEVVGFRGGYNGLDPSSGVGPVTITPEFVDDIHQKGGTILGTSRGPVDIGRAVDTLSLVVSTSFLPSAVMGHSAVPTPSTRKRAAAGTLSPSSVCRRRLTTMSASSRAPSDSPPPSRSPRACSTARTPRLEASPAASGSSGATIASQDVNFVFIPEVPFSLEAFLAALKRRMLAKSHALIAVAEGAGQDLLQTAGAQRDASGNVKLKDIGLFLRERIEAYFKAEGIPVVIRYYCD